MQDRRRPHAPRPRAGHPARTEAEAGGDVRYGPHDPSTAPTTLTVGYGSSEHETPLHPGLVAQREAVNRLAHGQPVTPQPIPLGAITEAEWATFTAALRQVARAGEVHQSDMRPLIRSIPHKHRGLLYRRAVATGLLRRVGHEESDDVAGRNAGRMEPRYELARSA